ncbi:Fork head 1 [Saccharomyces pastorianus]|uniref:Fork head 1 n=1 Tax=Saccharomyces pastorianus TaxID=27292 RepID=A0A6C1E9Z1_SACPS|nr:FKH1-like protein [Saccharomyces eubayanus]KOG98773.1 FKH1-like protein [Saccharomyces eubayanus]QID85761.1 Fork head 1 [Saccharomyces pastorianus]
MSVTNAEQEFSGKYSSYTVQDRQGLVNAVTCVLGSSSEPVAVSTDYSNNLSIAREVNAYAKIAGRDWTYYVQKLEVTIGRNTDSLSLNAHPDAVVQKNIDIDLGPAKIVSRKHAAIRFNLESGSWELQIFGRNGAKVNFRRIPTGPDSPPTVLQSGCIIDIGGVQMIFILPEQETIIPDYCLNHLMPKLLSTYGTNGNNNPLLRNVIEGSTYLREQRLQEEARLQRLDHLHTPLSSSSEVNALGDPHGDTIMMEDEDDDENETREGIRPNTYSASNSNVINNNIMPHIDNPSDLSLDENRYVKPPQSYASMITQAILSTPDGSISLADIYKFISDNYSFYRFSQMAWQNSVRHNLSLNKAFEKVPKRAGQQGKGMNWKISDEIRQDFLNKWNAGKLSKIRRGASVTRQLQLHMSKFGEIPAPESSLTATREIKAQKVKRPSQNTRPVLQETTPQLQETQLTSQMPSKMSMNIATNANVNNGSL